LGDEGACLLTSAIANVNTIVSLDLTSNQIGSAGGAFIFTALKDNQSIIDLNLSSAEGLARNTLGPAGVKPLAKVLQINQFLTFLNLAGNFIGDTGLGYICQGIQGGNNKGLKVMNLTLNDISDEGIELFREALPHSAVTDINLSRN
jgi:Ran GTPase-activating protein (RanGAP) involved in mRNA processing and transport